MKERSPLVSVIMPAHNASAFIAEAIRSVLGQTYPNWELIIVDDGSTDTTPSVVRSFVDKRVKYIREERRGQSAARNTAMQRASGVYLSFLDADDLFLPRKLELQVRYLEEHRSCGVCYADLIHFYTDEPGRDYHFDVPHPSGDILAEILRTNFINFLSVVMRRELAERVGFIDRSVPVNEDQFFWIKLAMQKAEFHYLDAVVGRYRFQRVGSNSRRRSHLRDAADWMLWIYGWVYDHFLESERLTFPLEAYKDIWRLKGFVGHLIDYDREGAEKLLYEWGKNLIRRPVAWILVGIERLLPVALLSRFLSFFYNIQLMRKMKPR